MAPSRGAHAVRGEVGAARRAGAPGCEDASTARSTRLVLRAMSAPRTPTRAPGHGSRCAGDTVGASAERGLGRPPTRLHLVVSRHPRLCRDHPTHRPPLGSAPRAGVSFVLGLVDAAPDRALSHAKAEGRRKAT